MAKFVKHAHNYGASARGNLGFNDKLPHLLTSFSDILERGIHNMTE